MAISGIEESRLAAHFAERIDSFRAEGAAAERSRIRRELLEEIATIKAEERHFLTFRADEDGILQKTIPETDIVDALDRICPGEP